MHTPLAEIIQIGAGTFKHDKNLPKLPVPNVKDTFELYLSSIKAITSGSTDEIERKINSFVKSEEAKILQAELTSRNEFMNNWIENWWLEEAYLKDRSPVIPYLNIAGRSALFKNVWPILELGDNKSKTLIDDEIVRRASRYVYSLMLSWICLRKEYVVTHGTKDGKPLCMDQLKKIFNTCRVPNENIDTIVCEFQLEGDRKCPNHIIVGCHGRIFIMKAVTEDNEVCKIYNIKQAFDEIIRFCEEKGPGPAIATLSSLPRNEWSAVYNQIRTFCLDNASNIDLIQSSIAWICLSTENPPHPQLYLEKALKVDARNVWGDKSLNISFLSNGLITYGSNHTPIDGIALASVIAFVEREIICGNGVDPCKMSVLSKISSTDAPVPWKEMTFELPTTYSQVIEKAYFRYLDLCSNIEAQTFTFSTFNRVMSRQLRLHPDTVFQLCLQLAYCRIHGFDKPATVYETATTRQFAYGRTETIRSCTVQCVEWMRAIDQFGPQDVRVGPLFLKAHHAHNELRSRCERGNGCDRHILGLRMMAKFFKSPLLEAIIKHPSYAASGSNSNFILSTSPMGAADSIGAVAPMCPNGYGVFYRIVENSCEAAVTSWRSEGSGRGSKLLEQLNECFRLIPIMYEASKKAKL